MLKVILSYYHTRFYISIRKTDWVIPIIVFAKVDQLYRPTWMKFTSSSDSCFSDRSIKIHSMDHDIFCLQTKKRYGQLHVRPSWRQAIIKKKKKRAWKQKLHKEKTLWSSVTGQGWECQPPRVLFSGREVESPILMCSYIFSFTGDQLSPLALTPTIYTHFTSLHRPHHRAPCWAVPAMGINRVSRHVLANAAHSHWGNPSEASRRLREMSERCGSDQSILAYRDADRSYLSLI